MISYFYQSTLFAIWFLVGASVRLDFKKKKKKCDKSVQSAINGCSSLLRPQDGGRILRRIYNCKRNGKSQSVVMNLC